MDVPYCLPCPLECRDLQEILKATLTPLPTKANPRRNMLPRVKHVCTALGLVFASLEVPCTKRELNPQKIELFASLTSANRAHLEVLPMTQVCPQQRFYEVAFPDARPPGKPECGTTAKYIEFVPCCLNSLLGHFLTVSIGFCIWGNGSWPCAALSYLEGSSVGHKNQKSLPS